jgi:hypothetical protein
VRIFSQRSDSSALKTIDEAVAAAEAGWYAVYDKARWPFISRSAGIALGEPYSATLAGDVWFRRYQTRQLRQNSSSCGGQAAGATSVPVGVLNWTFNAILGGRVMPLI